MAVPTTKAALARVVHQYKNCKSKNKHTLRRIKYYQKLLEAWPDWADTSKIQAVYKRRDSLNRITGKVHHTDHMVPISNNYVCGLHNEFNLQVLTEVENLQKSNHTWPDMWNEQNDLSLECRRVHQYALPL